MRKDIYKTFIATLYNSEELKTNLMTTGKEELNAV